jgi:hypothetical protein
MFFVRVNQVLVRLWARCGSKSDRMVCSLLGMDVPLSWQCVQRRLLCAERRGDPSRICSWRWRLVFYVWWVCEGLLIIDHEVLITEDGFCAW